MLRMVRGLDQALNDVDLARISSPPEAIADLNFLIQPKHDGFILADLN